MSHELRTPLGAIAGFTELLSLGARGSLTEEQQEDVRRIHGAYEHMSRVVEDLLSFNRIAAGTLALDIQDVDVGDLLRAVQELIGHQAVERGVSLTSDDLVGTQTVRADPHRLRQILLNLVGNAVKYTPSGGSVHIQATATTTDALIEIEDTGPGIPASEQASIFDPFIRLLHDKAAPGSGLGLAISREMARAIGGDVTVASEIDVGSRFSVRLPFSTRLANE